MIAAALGAALLLQACGQSEDQAAEAPAETAGPAAEPMEEMSPATTGASQGAQPQAGPFSTTGQVATIEGQSVSINHQAVEGLGWPAMTMTFQAPEATMLQGLEPGTPIQFSFRKDGDRYVLTEIKRQ